MLPVLDPEAAPTAAQTDWPICEHCLEPMSLDEEIKPDEEMIREEARFVFGQSGIDGLRMLRAISAEMSTPSRHEGAANFRTIPDTILT